MDIIMDEITSQTLAELEKNTKRVLEYSKKKPEF